MLPPVDEIPGFVGPEQVVAQSPDIVISLADLQQFSIGLQFTLVVRFRTDQDDLEPGELSCLLLHDPTPLPERLRWVVDLEDQETISNLITSDRATPPARAIVTLHGGGSSRLWRVQYWLAPFEPSAGGLAIRVSWPSRGVSEGRLEISQSELVEAGAKILPLFVDDRSSRGAAGPR